MLSEKAKWVGVSEMKNKQKKFIKNQKGMAMLEALPIIWVMFVLLGATLGSWGIAHTAVLNSIAARNFTFFLFNNRSDLSYLRDFGSQEYPDVVPVLSYDVRKRYYREDYNGGSWNGHGKRFSYITSETNPDDLTATLRRVDFRKINYDDRSDFLSEPEHTNIRNKIEQRNINKKVGPAWIMVGYGICLSAKCGDN